MKTNDPVMKSVANLTWIIIFTAFFGAHALQRIGEKCVDKSECESNRECRNGTCQCLPGESFFEGECVSRVGAYCEKDEDCKVPKTDCKRNRCNCTFAGYYEEDGRCATGVLAPCRYNSDCDADNTFCNSTERRCQCEPHFITTPIYMCAPFAQYHKPCNYDEQCSSTMPHTSCNVTDQGQRCECTGKYFFKDGECYPRKYVPDKCDRWDECFTPNSYCKNGLCACLPSYELEEGECREAKNSSTISRPFFIFVTLVWLGMKVLS